MTTIIKQCRGEKTRDIRAIDGFRNKLMIPDSEILLRFMKLILIFMNTMKKSTS